MFYFKGTRKPDFKNIKKIDYDEYWKSRGFEMRSKLLEREQIFFDWIKPGSKVLDIGCGNSRLTYELFNAKQCQCSAIDTSPLVVEDLKNAGINAWTADIEAAEFTIDGEYDYIVMSEVLEHTRFPEDIIKKLKSHTRKFTLSIPNSAFYRYRIGLMFSGRFFTQWAMHPSEHLRYWSHKDFLDWLAAQDLQIEKFKASNGFELKDLWPNMFGHQICYLASVK